MTVPRKVYIYKKANMNGMTQHLDNENKMFLPIIQKQIAFKNVGENLKKYYHRL